MVGVGVASVSAGVLAVAEARLLEVGSSVLGLVSGEVVTVMVECSLLRTNGAATVATSSDKAVEVAGGGEDCISVAASSLPLPIIMIR